MPVGRDGELSLLRGFVDEVAAGRGASVLVEGEPGVGKSALLTTAVNGAGALGCRVLWGAGDELGRRFPLRPLVECLDAGGQAGDERRTAINRLLRGQAPGAGVFGGGDPVAAAAEQVLALVDELCAITPLVLVVEDLHWADEVTVGVWHRLALSVNQLPLLIMGSARPVPQRADVAALRRNIGPPHGVVMSLGPLSRPAVLELVANLVSGRPGSRLAELAAQAGGNPLYVTELVAALRRDAALRVAGGEVEAAADAAPASLARATAGRVDFLTSSTRDLLRSASVLGMSFTVAEVATVTGAAVSQLIGPLQEAIAAGLLTETGGSLTFRHELIRDALYQDMPGTLRTALHDGAARALADAGMPVDRVAAQVLAAGPIGDTWVRTWLANAATTLIGQAPEVAAELLQAAVDAAPAGDTDRNMLATRLVAAHYRCGRPEDGERVARATLAGTSDPELVGELARLLAECLLVAGRFGEILSEMDRALAVPGLGPVHAARLQLMAARAHGAIGDLPAAALTGERALAAGRAAGDPWATGYALHVLGVVDGYRGRHTEAIAIFEKALAIAADSPDLSDLRLLLLMDRAISKFYSHSEDIRATLPEIRRLAEQTGNLPRLGHVRAMTVDVEYATGRWDDALAEVEAGIPADPQLANHMHGIAALIALHRDDTGTARRHLTGPITPTGYWDTYLLQAWALEHERAGRPDKALAALNRTRDTEKWFEELGPAVRLAVLAGDLATARDLTRHLERIGAEGGPGELQFCQGLVDADSAQLTEAADIFRRADRPLKLAQALEAAADLHAKAGSTATARRQFNEAIAVYTRLGAAWDIHRADAHFRALGIRRSRRGPRTDPRTLTPTENTVAELVTQGLSNPQIADQLFLSRRTVQTHVSHILTKLDLRSRVEIAREFTRSPLR